MQKYPTHSALGNSRISLPLALSLIGVFSAMLSFAATPASTITRRGAKAATTRGIAPSRRTIEDNAAASMINTTVCASPLSDKCPVWAATYDFSQAGGREVGEVVALSPGGDRLYVAGQSYNSATGGTDSVTIAYDAFTGNQIWASRFEAPPNWQNIWTAIALSPDGTRVYVSGQKDLHFGPNSSSYATAVYDAGTGAQLWVATYHGVNDTFDYATSLGVSTDGRFLYVTGQSPGGFGNQDYATIAYDAATGQQRWLSLYQGVSYGIGQALKVSPDGTRVYVTGATTPPGEPISFGTVAYNAATGEQVWNALWKSTDPNVTDNEAFNLALSPDGSKLFATGFSGSGKSGDFATVAYNAQTGQQLWVSNYRSSSATQQAMNVASEMHVSPDGDRVYIAGYSSIVLTTLPRAATYDYATVAYDAATGNQLWVSRFDGGADDVPVDLAVSPDGLQVFVTGLSKHGSVNESSTPSDFLTLAYNSSTGSQLWQARYNSTGAGVETGFSLAVSLDGRNLYITGQGSDTTGQDAHIVTLAYDTGIILPTAAVSRKTHGTAGVFDINLPPAGTPGIECRSEGETGNHHVVFSFSSPVTVRDATVTPGNSKSAETDGPPVTSADGKEVTVNLKNVTNVQKITITLVGVSDGTSANDVSVQMGVLAGDTTADRFVNSGDIAQTKSQSGQVVSAANFREDVDADGSVNSGDIALVKSKSGTALP